MAEPREPRRFASSNSAPLLLLLGTLALAACRDAGGDGVRLLSGSAMGSTWHVKWHGKPDEDLVRSAVLAELDAADRTFSNWGRDSEIRRFNTQRTTEPFEASALLREGVRLGLAVAVASDGAFDPTVKPLSDAYRAAKRGGATLDTGVLAAARARVGFQHLHVVGTTLVKDRPDLELDLDGLVAGLCADHIGERLRALGVAGFMLEITGEVLCDGVKPDGSPWRIGIADPEQASAGQESALISLPLRDAALCTSGDYRNFVIQGGKVQSHVFDPRTAGNPTHGVVSVSVLARSCALADALGTALMVTGPDGAASVFARCAEPTAGAWYVLAAADGSLHSEAVAWPEAFSLAGHPLPTVPPASARLPEAERMLAEAVAKAAASPGDVAAAVWHGRRLAELGRHRDAVAAWTKGLELHPDDPHLLWHRGLGQITRRELAAAERDLARAAEIVGRQQGSAQLGPNPITGAATHTTLHFDVHYHLGLARFFLGEFPGAATAFQESLSPGGSNAECLALASQWLWCSLMRSGKQSEAQAVLARVGAGLPIVAHRDSYDLCRFYQGALPRTEIRPTSSLLAFGLAHHDLVTGKPSAAMDALKQLARSEPWSDLGVIAAEAEVQRMSVR